MDRVVDDDWIGSVVALYTTLSVLTVGSLVLFLQKKQHATDDMTLTSLPQQVVSCLCLSSKEESSSMA